MINMERPGVSVIIVTYNSAKYIEKCLNSLRINLGPRDEIIIVDNNSSDNTIETILRMKLPRLRVLKLRKNVGFPLACNIGALEARNNILLFINPDIVLGEDCINKLVDALIEYSDIGEVQPKIYNAYTGLLDGVGGFMDILGHGFHLGEGEPDLGQYNERMNILYATFACAMIYRKLFFRIGGMDSLYFLYNEDLDLALRIWLHGYRAIYVPEAIAYHIGQHSTRRRPYVSLYFGRRNRLLTIAATYPWPLVLVTIPVLGAVYIAGSIFSRIRGKDKVDSFTFIKALISLWKKRSHILNKRLLVKSIARKNSLYDLLKMKLITTKLVGLILYIRGVYRMKLFKGR